MTIKRYQAPDAAEVWTRTDHLQDYPQRISQSSLLPQIARMSKNAVNVVPIYVDFFQRLKTGRRCSCFIGAEADPMGICPVCWGTGIVGGYQKRGVKQEIADVTTTWSAVNIQADYGSSTRPIYWTLLPSAVYGTLNFSFPINKNIGSLDVFETRDFQPQGTEIQYLLRTDNEPDFVPLTRSSLQARLGFQRVHFQVNMRRSSPASELPKLQLIRFSYRTQKFSALRADIPRATESNTMEEFGIQETWSSQTFYFDNTLKNINTEDFLVNLMDGTRWKVTEAQRNAPMNYLLSWDVTARKVHNYEPYWMVPVGDLDAHLPADFIRSIQTEGNRP